MNDGKKYFKIGIFGVYFLKINNAVSSQRIILPNISITGIAGKPTIKTKVWAWLITWSPSSWPTTYIEIRTIVNYKMKNHRQYSKCKEYTYCIVSLITKIMIEKVLKKNWNIRLKNQVEKNYIVESSGTITSIIIET